MNIGWEKLWFRDRDTSGGGDAEINHNNNNNLSRSAGMKALKLPPFDEDKDDLDAYLIRFEPARIASEVRQKHRPTQYETLEIYQWLADDEVDYYDVLEAQLLKRLRKIKKEYRKRFKSSTFEQGETPAQFAERLKRHWRNGEKWQVMMRPIKAFKKWFCEISFFFWFSPSH